MLQSRAEQSIFDLLECDQSIVVGRFDHRLHERQLDRTSASNNRGEKHLKCGTGGMNLHWSKSRSAIEQIADGQILTHEVDTGCFAPQPFAP